MAVDYGESRTGIAISDVTEFLASPVGIIKEKNTLKAIEKIAQQAKELRAEMIVIGNPVNMDGTQGERAQKCRDFADKLRELTGIETVMLDERVTTVQAIGILNETNVRGKKRKEVIDTVAATLILESYMDYRKKKGLA